MNYPRFFAFVAQSLDNRSPDPISVDGHLLASENLRSPERTELIDDTTYIYSRGKKVQVRDGSACQGFVLDREVLIEITSSDRDEGGRASPILCLGHLDRPDKSVWGDVALSELDEFADKIGRNIDARVVSDFKQLTDRIFASPPERLLRRVLGFRDSSASWPGETLPDQRPQQFQNKTSPVQNATAATARGPESSYSKPQAILAVDGADERLVRSDPNLAALLNDSGIFVLNLPASGQFEQHLVSILKSLGLVKSPSLIIRDPYNPDRYFRAADLGVEMAKSKHRAYQDMCQLLGAKEVIVESINEVAQASERNSKISGSVDPGEGVEITGDRSVKNTFRKDLTEQFRLEQKHLGGHADLDAADEFMRSRSLHWDGDLSHLLDVVRNRENPPMELTLNFGTKQAVDRVTRSIDHLEAVIAGLRLDRDVHERYDAVYTFRIAISF